VTRIVVVDNIEQVIPLEAVTWQLLCCSLYRTGCINT